MLLVAINTFKKMLLQVDECNSCQTFLKLKSVQCFPVRVSIRPRLCLSAPAPQVSNYILKLQPPGASD